MSLGLILTLFANASEPPLMTFTRTETFSPFAVQVDVGSLDLGEAEQYWFRLTVSERNKKARWSTDTLRCPQSRQVLQSAAQLKSPSISIAGITTDHIRVQGDGAAYELRTESRYESGGADGSLVIRARDETPLADWVDQSLRTLHPCWTRKRVAP